MTTEGIHPTGDSETVVLHDHLTETPDKSVYLAAVERKMVQILYVDGNYYWCISGNRYVEGHEKVRTSSPGGNQAEEWTLMKLEPDRVIEFVRSQLLSNARKAGYTGEISNEYVNKVLQFIRGEITVKPRLS
jgi:hypothetical protein